MTKSESFAGVARKFLPAFQTIVAEGRGNLPEKPWLRARAAAHHYLRRFEDRDRVYAELSKDDLPKDD